MTGDANVPQTGISGTGAVGTVVVAANADVGVTASLPLVRLIPCGYRYSKRCCFWVCGYGNCRITNNWR